MVLEDLLKKNFPLVLRAYFEEEFKTTFLRLEVNLTKMADVEKLSREISDFLDANYDTDKEYYLDVFSKGSDLEFQYHEANEHLEKYIEIEFNNELNPLVCKLKNVSEEILEVLENRKGQMKKHLIKKEDITKLTLHIKI